MEAHLHSKRVASAVLRRTLSFKLLVGTYAAGGVAFCFDYFSNSLWVLPLGVVDAGYVVAGLTWFATAVCVLSDFVRRRGLPDRRSAGREMALINVGWLLWPVAMVSLFSLALVLESLGSAGP